MDQLAVASSWCLNTKRPIFAMLAIFFYNYKKLEHWVVFLSNIIHLQSRSTKNQSARVLRRGVCAMLGLGGILFALQQPLRHCALLHTQLCHSLAMRITLSEGVMCNSRLLFRSTKCHILRQHV